MKTIEEICKTLTQDQIGILYYLVNEPSSEVAKIVESYIRYNSYFNPCKNCDPNIVCKTPFCERLKTPTTTEYIGKKSD